MTNFHSIIALETTNRGGYALGLEEAHDAIILEFARSEALRAAAQNKAAEVEASLLQARRAEDLVFISSSGEKSWNDNGGPTITLTVAALENKLTILRALGYGEKPPADFGLITLSAALHALI